MAKDRKKLQHMHSSILDKQPTPASLEVGEIAVNNAKDKEFLSIKNSNDKVVRFSSDGQIIEWMERKEVMPYKGYVRGKVGVTGTEDDYKSYGITTDDLIRNESNIVIKLNQVAASATTKHDLVNGSKDKYGNLVNPTTDGGVNDGAGFFIDMSRYAMQGANPSFSGITTTCYANLNGTTKIKGTNDSCGSLFEVNVNTINETGNTVNISGNTVNISGTTTISGTCTIGDTLIVKKGLEKSLSWAYGSVCNEPTSATSTNFKNDARFIIPKTLSDVSCGVVDLTDGCLNINKNICVGGKIEVSNGVFNTSDRRLKENIKKVGFEKMLAARNVTIQQFNYKNSDDNRLTYGIIAQEVQERNLPEIVYINEDGHMSVDYTSLMILKIAYLENEVKRLTDKLGQVLEKLDNK